MRLVWFSRSYTGSVWRRHKKMIFLERGTLGGVRFLTCGFGQRDGGMKTVGPACHIRISSPIRFSSSLLRSSFSLSRCLGLRILASSL